MAARLAPCPSCTRHVKVGSASCPFCSSAVPVDVPARPMPSTRPLTRAAILFASAAAASACSSSSTPPTGAKDAAVSKDATDDLGQGMTLYGVAVLVCSSAGGECVSPGSCDGELLNAYPCAGGTVCCAAGAPADAGSGQGQGQR